MFNHDNEQELIQSIYSAIAKKDEKGLNDYWQRWCSQYPVTDELLLSKWQFYFDNHDFELIIQEAEKLPKEFSINYPQACILYLESYLALNQPEVAGELYYQQHFTHHRQWQLLLSKINREIAAQQQMYSYQLSLFSQLSLDEQLILLEKLIQSKSKFYIDQVSDIIHKSCNQVVITWGLLYLKEVNSDKEVVYHRKHITYILKPVTLPTIEQSQVYQMNCQILDYIDKHYPNIKEVAEYMTVILFNHYYPKYDGVYSVELWAEGILAYYNSIMLGQEMDMTKEINQIIVNLIN